MMDKVSHLRFRRRVGRKLRRRKYIHACACEGVGGMHIKGVWTG